jgi:26S proteasome regulatory subunit N7
MPVENMEEEGLAKNPDLLIAQWKFQLESVPSYKNDNALKEKLLGIIKENKMSPYYEIVCKDLHWSLDANLLKEMKEDNKKTLAELEEKIKDAEENLGESEHREALLKKSEHLARIGDKDAAVEAVRMTNTKTVGLGNRMDLVFLNIRIGLFFMDHEIIKANIDKARTMLDEGGDWDRRNRLKVYEGLYAMSIRDFERSARLFLDAVSTFTSYELMDYVLFVKYSVYIALIALDRQELHKQVIKGSEILEVLHQCPEVKNYLFSLYECRYGDFFQCLGKVEQVLKEDRYLAPHYAFYVREMKVKAYGQLLESYRSLTLKYMADAFGVTEDYMDSELCRFIASGRLHAKIDKVGGIVITNRPDSKNAQYQTCIKQGDILLNRVQKLSRVINI